jgi:Kae1-associated kinase Bud32
MNSTISYITNKKNLPCLCRMTEQEQLPQGAEAILTRDGDSIIKARPVKRYRHPTLDHEIRTRRTAHEARILERAKKAGVPVPAVTVLDETTLSLSRAQGVEVKAVLDADPLLAHQIGRDIARMHDAGIIHGDLTTSNMFANGHDITIIDFGLAFHSTRDEDKAVDLHVFHQSLKAKHHRVEPLAYRHFLKGYRDTSAAGDAVIKRLRVVEARGRNKGS